MFGLVIFRKQYICGLFGFILDYFIDGAQFIPRVSICFAICTTHDYA